MNPIRRVSVLSTGTVMIRPEHAESNGTPLMWWLNTSRRWTQPRPINVYVIEHERGLVLFDTGQDRASVTEPDYFPSGFAGHVYRRLARFEIAPHETLTRRLEGLGYDIADVRVAVLSHLHQDHIGGLPGARSGEDHGAPGRLVRDPSEVRSRERLPHAPHRSAGTRVGVHLTAPGGRPRPRAVHRRPRPLRRRNPHARAHPWTHAWVHVAPRPSAGHAAAPLRRRPHLRSMPGWKPRGCRESVIDTASSPLPGQ